AEPKPVSMCRENLDCAFSLTRKTSQELHFALLAAHLITLLEFPNCFSGNVSCEPFKNLFPHDFNAPAFV
ncbi:MAG TPA: hypothetical protein VNA16_00310, partial [Abditibacteriaceae bacterium]|nr:hypothetical protein [Abditibacteriaceae bacterium]